MIFKIFFFFLLPLLGNSQNLYISTFAGTDSFNGDDILATAAQLDTPFGVALDSARNLYIVDSTNQRIRKVTVATGRITTVVGNGIQGYNTNVNASSGLLNNPYSVTVDSAGNIYIGDTFNNRICKVTVATGLFTTLVGNGTQGYNGDNILATNALLNRPRGIAVDSAGNIYIADAQNHRIRRITVATGRITTVAGNGTAGYNGDDIPAVDAQLNAPYGVAVDSAGNLYIADAQNHRIRLVNISNGIITTVAGVGSAGFGGDDSEAIYAQLNTPRGVALDSTRNIYIADSTNQRIRKVTVATGIITTVAGIESNTNGGYNGDNITATTAQLNGPFSLSVDSAGNIYIADSGNNRIRKVTVATRIITTVAGNGTQGYNGDNILSTRANLNDPVSVAFDAAGNLYIADYTNNRIRKVTAATGIITTVAGSGTQGYNGDNIQATTAQLNGPYGVALDAAGNVYIADTFSSRVRKVTVATGIITTVVGTGGVGYNGDNITATDAQLGYPTEIAIDAAGNLYITDFGNNRIRKVSATTGLISTVAGNGIAGYSGDDIAATDAQISGAYGLTVDSAGNIFIADTANNRVRKVTVATGRITTVAGTGTAGYNGDNVLATNAQINNPFGVGVDSAGNIYVADTLNHRVRKVTVATGIITTVVGSGTRGYNGDNILAIQAHINGPNDVVVDASGNLYIADTFNNRIRRASASSSTGTTTPNTGTDIPTQGTQISSQGTTTDTVESGQESTKVGLLVILVSLIAFYQL